MKKQPTRVIVVTQNGKRFTQTFPTARKAARAIWVAFQDGFYRRTLGSSKYQYIPMVSVKYILREKA